MLIINFYGAPGAGKTTMSSAFFAILKDRGYKVSLISEAATDLIESGQSYTLTDFEYQPYVTGAQFRKIKDQERLGTEFLITDSPVLHQLNFIKNSWLFQPMKDMYTKLMDQFETFDVLVLRGKKYSTYKRVTTDEESLKIQEELLKSKYDLVTPGAVKNLNKLIKAFDKKYRN